MNFEKYSIVEAKDTHGTWYPAKVLEVSNGKVRVHFCNWSSRYDTWIPITSDRLRPLRRLRQTSSHKSSKLSSVDKPIISTNSAPLPAKNTAPFELGSYVMAAWRNQYEYLAEVIAHRLQPSGKSEYRLRYIWDNVIEWTAAHRLRTATQSEIDYVFKFCNEHGGVGAGLPLSEVSANCTATPRRSSTTDRSFDSRFETPLTRSRSSKLGSELSTSYMQSMDTVPTITPSIVPKVVEKTEHPGWQQDDMLYDKTVLQFHEACRKRRELKRHAFESPQRDSVPSSGEQLSDDQVKTETPSSSFNLTPPYSNPPEGSSPVLHQLDTSMTERKVQKRSTKFSPSIHISGQNTVEDFKTSPNKTVEPIKTEARTLLTKSKSPTTSKLIDDNKLEVSVDSSTTQSTICSFVKSESRSSKVSKISAATLSAPVTYSCPFCSRRFRHLKLLSAHIANYHDEKTASNQSTTDPSVTKSPENNPRTSFAEMRDSCSIPAKSDSKLTEKTPEVKQPPESPTDNEILLACYPCNTRHGVSRTRTPDLLECQSCFCWSHRTCYREQTNPSYLGSSSFFCDGCLLTLRRARRSRMADLYIRQLCAGELLFDNRLNHELSESEKLKRKLIMETAELLNQSYRLNPLLTTGWNMLNNTKPPPENRSVGHMKPQYVPVATTIENSTVTCGPDDLHLPNEPHEQQANNNDQLNRLYMEFRASLADPDSCANSTQPSTEDEPTVLPVPTASWSLNEPAVDPSNLDGSMNTNHMLSGFLQELGPNVISELTEIGASQIEDNIIQPPPNESQKGLTDMMDTPLTIASTGSTCVSWIMSPPKVTSSIISACPPSTTMEQPIPTALAASSPSTCTFPSLNNMELLSSSNENSSIPINTNLVSIIPAVSPSDTDSGLDHPLLEAIVTSANLLTRYDSNIEKTINMEYHASSSQSSISNDKADSSQTVAPNILLMDWLNVPVTNSVQMPCPETSLPSGSKKDNLSDASIYDALGGPSFGPDTITDTFTPGDLFEAHRELDNLEMYVLTPLESMLSSMDLQLKSITRQLEAELDLSSLFPPNERDTNDDNLANSFSAGSKSPKSSSPSSSPSPKEYEGIHTNVPKGAHLPSHYSEAYHDHFTKQSARRLYTFLMSSRSKQSSACCSGSTSYSTTPNAKGHKMFKRSPRMRTTSTNQN